jgi:DNA-binding LacI/PurR family transcriptional regulator
MKRITLRDIAARAGVSHVTVSLALRKHPRIPVKTQIRIRKLADEMGYVPDPALGRLNAYRRGASTEVMHSAIAWINFWKNPRELDKVPTYHQYREGAVDRAGTLGYHIEEFRLASGELSTSRFVGILKSRGISGILIPPFPEYLDKELNVPWDNYSTVRFGHSGSHLLTHSVSNEQYQTAYDAVEECVKRGYRSLGYYFNYGGERKTRGRFLGGYLAGCHLYKLGKRIPPLITKDSYVDQHEDLFMNWFNKHRPEVVFTQHEQVYNWLENNGFSIPKEVAVVHLALPTATRIKFSGMHQNSHLIGAQAVNLLDRLIRHGERGIPEVPVEVDVKSIWINGDTA